MGYGPSYQDYVSIEAIGGDCHNCYFIKFLGLCMTAVSSETLDWAPCGAWHQAWVPAKVDERPGYNIAEYCPPSGCPYDGIPRCWGGGIPRDQDAIGLAPCDGAVKQQMWLVAPLGKVE